MAGRAHAREALEREVMRHTPTRLDRLISGQLPEGASIRVSRLVAPDGDRAVIRALRARAREPAGMRLAAETRRGVLTFEPDWKGRLKAKELHLDVRKRLLEQQRLQPEARERSRARSRGKGPGRQIPIYFLTHRRGARADLKAGCTRLQLARPVNLPALADAQPFPASRH